MSTVRRRPFSVRLDDAGDGIWNVIDADGGLLFFGREEDVARLFAAAPDLFDACEEAFDFLGGVDEASAIRDKLVNAILKARPTP